MGSKDVKEVTSEAWEAALKEQGFKSKNPRMREQVSLGSGSSNSFAMIPAREEERNESSSSIRSLPSLPPQSILIIAAVRARNSALRLSMFTTILVSLLEDADGQVRETAREVSPPLLCCSTPESSPFFVVPLPSSPSSPCSRPLSPLLERRRISRSSFLPKTFGRPLWTSSYLSCSATLQLTFESSRRKEWRRSSRWTRER